MVPQRTVADFPHEFIHRMKKRLKQASQSKAPKPEDLDLDPDAWPKFEKLVKDAAKMGPKPHTGKTEKVKTVKRRAD